MKQELELALFRDIARRFESFLNDEQNNKILFSGKYGSGKTTFLQTYFDERNLLELNNPNVQVFYITPIDYSVASNEDIIELIKYDLILQFLQQKIPITTYDIPSYQLIGSGDVKGIFIMLLSLINYKGIDIGKILEGLKDLKEKLDKRKVELDEGDMFANFLEEIESQKNIFDRNIITILIERVIKRVEEEKQTILIIDDLDRIDPEHVFRILNVFSAHFNSDTYSRRGQLNKFGFSKVLIVCDYNNLKSLFHSRYGAEADFSGYIDKFYYREVFDFDIKKEVKRFLFNVLNQMDDTVRKIYGSEFKFFDRGDEFFQQTIIYAILFGEISLRTILKLKSFKLDPYYLKIGVALSRGYAVYDYTTFLIYINLFLFGDANQIVRIINLIASRGVVLNLDPDSISFLASVEAIFAKPLDKGRIEIATALANYVLTRGKNDSWDIVGREEHSKGKMMSQNEIAVDLMTFLIVRLNQIINSVK